MKSRRVALFTAVILTVALVVTMVLLLALAIPVSGRSSSSTQQETSQTEITTTSPNSSSSNNTDNTTPNNSTNNNGNNNSNTGNNNGTNNNGTNNNGTNNNGTNNNGTNNNGTNNNNKTDCPQIHILAARETTAPPPFGTSKVLVDLILKAFPGTNQATVEAIDYPAAGSTVAEYAASVAAGVAAVVRQTGEFNQRCPGSLVVMHGYSQVCSSYLTCPGLRERGRKADGGMTV